MAAIASPEAPRAEVGFPGNYYPVGVDTWLGS